MIYGYGGYTLGSFRNGSYRRRPPVDPTRPGRELPEVAVKLRHPRTGSGNTLGSRRNSHHALGCADVDVSVDVGVDVDRCGRMSQGYAGVAWLNVRWSTEVGILRLSLWQNYFDYVVAQLT